MVSIMKFLQFLILICAFSCEAQTVDEQVILLLRNISDGQTELSNQLKEQAARIEMLEGSLSSVKEIIQEQQVIKTSLQQCPWEEQIDDIRRIITTDECINSSQIHCSQNATCIDTTASYRCECLPGFSGDGITCEDKDECTDGTNTCGINEVCVNLPGSYQCQCPEGFKIVHNICQDRDECSDGKYNCSVNEDCRNIPGSYQCYCKDGFKEIENTCQDYPNYSNCGSLRARSGITGVISAVDDDDVDCKWYVTTPPGTTISITFTRFELEACCDCDWVQIFEYSTQAPITRKLCGSNIPFPVSSTTNEILIKFQTDYEDSKVGFELVYKAVFYN